MCAVHSRRGRSCICTSYFPSIPYYSHPTWLITSQSSFALSTPLKSATSTRSCPPLIVPQTLVCIRTIASSRSPFEPRYSAPPRQARQGFCSLDDVYSLDHKFAMAATLHVPSPSDSQMSSANLPESFSRRLTINELDLKDSRYPSLSQSSKHRPSLSNNPMHSSYSDRPTEPSTATDTSRASWVEYSPPLDRYSGYGAAWVAEKLTEEPREQPMPSQHLQTRDITPQTQGMGLVADASNGSYHPAPGSPAFANHDPGDARRVSRDNIYVNSSPFPSPREQQRPSFDPGAVQQSPEMGQRASGVDQYRDSQYIASPRHPSLPTAGVGAGPSSPSNSPIVPMSAGPSYSPAAAAAAMAIPISPKPRAFAQQPTYINPSSANPSYAPPQVPKEEVCVECAMRDQDMADVDVTTPGIWERESDALYEELLRREEMEEAGGVPQQESSIRPRAKGHWLTEENLKLWLSVVRRHHFYIS